MMPIVIMILVISSMTMAGMNSNEDITLIMIIVASMIVMMIETTQFQVYKNAPATIVVVMKIVSAITTIRMTRIRRLYISRFPIVSEDGIQQTMQGAEDPHDDSESSSDSDTDMPILVGRQGHDADSDNNTSDGSYDYGGNEQQRGYHTDNDNSSVDDSDDDSNNTIPSLQECARDDSSSDEDSEYNHDHTDDQNPEATHQSVPHSIKMYPIMSEWSNDNTDGDEYDGDNDDDEMSRRSKNSSIPALRLRGGDVTPVVETVTEEENEEERADHELPQLSTNRPTIPTPTPTSSQKPEYDPMADEPPPAIITPSYILLR